MSNELEKLIGQKIVTAMLKALVCICLIAFIFAGLAGLFSDTGRHEDKIVIHTGGTDKVKVNSEEKPKIKATPSNVKPSDVFNETSESITAVNLSNYQDQHSITISSYHDEEKSSLKWETRNYLFSDPNYFYAIHVVSPTLERILSHRAYMTGRQMDSDEAKRIVDSDVDFSFILSLGVACPDCAKGIIFYEKNISGRPMTVDEYEELLDQPNFGQIIESAKADDYVVGLFQ